VGGSCWSRASSTDRSSERPSDPHTHGSAQHYAALGQREQARAERIRVRRRLDVVLNHHHSVQQVHTYEHHGPIVDLDRDGRDDRHMQPP
jgi:hypothetical protein